MCNPSLPTGPLPGFKQTPKKEKRKKRFASPAHTCDFRLNYQKKKTKKKNASSQDSCFLYRTKGEGILGKERKTKKSKKMKALGWWLMLVGSLRLASVWFGFVDIWALRLAVFSNTTS